MSIYKFILNILNSIEQHPFRLIVALILYATFYQFGGGLVALFGGIFCLIVLFNFDTRILIFIGLIFFAFVPFYLFQRKELMAEEMAFYGYYSLLLGVCSQIIAYIKKNSKLNFGKIFEKLKCLRRK